MMCITKTMWVYTATFCTCFVYISVLFHISYERKISCCNKGSEDGNVLWVEIQISLLCCHCGCNCILILLNFYILAILFHFYNLPNIYVHNCVKVIFSIIYVTGPAKIHHVSANYTDLYVC